MKNRTSIYIYSVLLVSLITALGAEATIWKSYDRGLTLDGRIVFLAIIALLFIAVLSLYSRGDTSNTFQNTSYGLCPTKTVRLQGSGSTFIWPAISVWGEAFKKICPGVVIDYGGGGSGKGQKDIVNKLVDFAGSDVPLIRTAWKRYEGRILQAPVVLGAIAVVYNVPELEGYTLRLNGEVLAKIYLGEIEYWDDPMIKSLNPNVSDRLPHKRIIAVHRSDSSGTTAIFTLFLHKSSNGIWPRDLVGKSIDWPVDKTGRGVGQQGNPGVTEAIKQNKYSIGYVELAYALEHNLSIAAIENPYGEYVLPTPETISAAFAVDEVPTPLDDWTSVVEEFVYSKASRNAYPITGQTFIIVWREQDDYAKCVAIKSFLNFIASEGQDILPTGYAPLPKTLRQVVEDMAELIMCK